MKLQKALHIGARIASAVFILASVQVRGFAQESGPCPRFPVGSAISAPRDLFSRHGVLQVNFSYQTATDRNGNTLYCFVTESGAESPTLHVRPGDRLAITLTNNIPASNAMTMPGMTVSGTASDTCGAVTMTASSVNIHYHGTNTAPVCHQDEVIHTLINSGETFQYDVRFPWDEPPGLYWYHPHVHGMSEAAVLGGASGALIVEGIQNVNPEVAGLPQQLLVIRDNLVPGNPAPGGNVPSWDVSLNYVPVPYPAFTPAVIRMKPAEKQFWRVLNASADTIIDLQLTYDGAPQPLQIVALDGVPTGSQDGTSRGKSIMATDIPLAPAARAEFIVTGPAASVQSAILATLNVDTGPDGDNDPARPIAAIKARDSVSEPPLSVPDISGPPHTQRFAGLDRAQPTAERRLYFSEVLSDPNDPNSPTNFYITVDGQTPTLYSPDNPPAIVTTQGSVEDWTIENRAMENHEFHIHQIHFLVLEQNGVGVNNGQYLDTIQVPYWSGSGPYPSVKVRMDFRGPLVGDFVYHCHILGHEDAGMMAIIRVKPR
ncbi:MAG TPA: multicopper oxidase domain-containing protein [Bryobacteraceae bacterium]|nr:multicopper oxidase domain-containing protein [Bryobacteraceae bacterium]